MRAITNKPNEIIKKNEAIFLIVQKYCVYITHDVYTITATIAWWGQRDVKIFGWQSLQFVVVSGVVSGAINAYYLLSNYYNFG